METKHTPGPWKFRPSIFSEFYIETVDQSSDKTFIGEVGGGLQSKQEIIANAKLVAAAPELLEALLEIISITDRNHVTWYKAKAAIKKATE
jgi:hypothetical protein